MPTFIIETQETRTYQVSAPTKPEAVMAVKNGHVPSMTLESVKVLSVEEETKYACCTHCREKHIGGHLTSCTVGACKSKKAKLVKAAKAKVVKAVA